MVKNGPLVGNGVGQQDRVGGCALAVKRAQDVGHDTQGAVAYSDSFFPFIDGLEVLAKAGVEAIFATRGSVRDGEIKKFCSNHNITLITLPDSLARGFLVIKRAAILLRNCCSLFVLGLETIYKKASGLIQ